MYIHIKMDKSNQYKSTLLMDFGISDKPVVLYG